MERRADHEAWLQVGLTPGVGSQTFGKLLQQFGDPAAILAAKRPELEALGLRQQTIDQLLAADPSRIQASLDWLEQPGNQLLTLGDPDYPPLLKQIDAAPPLLYVRGDTRLLAQPQLGMVGSRNPTPTGMDNARRFAGFLAGSGLTITSGLASGIDGAAHQGALREGRTIAVCATGLDRVYPASHRKLAHQIAEQGVLVSELPPGSGVRRENFPRRNRIISGLSLGVLVVEATVQSGSLITARLAMEQGREVFAIPGSIHNPQARGCHLLIRQGAKLVETAQDIIEELGSLLGTMELPEFDPPATTDNPRQLDDDYLQLLESMGFDPQSADQIIKTSGLPADVVSSMLLLLELQGYVSSSPGGYYYRTSQTADTTG